MDRSKADLQFDLFAPHLNVSDVVDFALFFFRCLTRKGKGKCAGKKEKAA